MNDRDRAAQLIWQIIDHAGSLIEDMRAGDVLGKVRNESRLRADFEEAEEFHQAHGDGVAIGDLSAFLTSLATGEKVPE